MAKFTKTDQNITVVFPDGPKTVDASHENYDALWQAIQDDASEQELRKLASLGDAIAEYVGSAKDLDVSVEVRNGVVYVDDKPEEGFVVDKILEFMAVGEKEMMNTLMLFFARCAANPVAAAADQLYKFMEHGNMPLTPDGHVVGYKGLKNDFWSVQGNTRTKVFQGKVDQEGHILNEIGKTIEVARECVDVDQSEGCGEGIHIGSFNYAKGWAQGKLVLVEFDPADACCVPHDHNYEKLRACKYFVVAEVDQSGDKVEPIQEPIVITGNTTKKNAARYHNVRGKDGRFSSVVKYYNYRDKNGRFTSTPRDENGRFAKKASKQAKTAKRAAKRAARTKKRSKRK